MSRVSWRPLPGLERPALVAAPGRDAVLCAVVVALAASVTAVAAVIALVPPGRRHAWWALAAVVFSIMMGLSRGYLGAHWLSDAIAGILLGTSCAVVTALMVGQIQRRVKKRQGAAWK
jgi:membrane-associated phospholipid phosphatase